MIATLRGTIIYRDEQRLIVEVCGVGYAVISLPSVCAELSIGQEMLFYVHDHVREDAHDLYGFFAREDVALFEALISVSGVGPKVALAVMALGSADVVRSAVMQGDIDRLTSVSGVGKKIAQKIILELKGQLVDMTESRDESDVIAALQGLGYSRESAKRALEQVGREIMDPSVRVRQALRFLGQR